ncbi:hypothetical protein OWV82_021645 [Melia azedarach]|uniref:Uncharacterized protein n=1 Tax=Melia azedarach TaxID=155640 RepID=A0ACC1X0U2_MELAZ|nr:hypothetical protein OWV82_021645 [Melia azedarach]
MFRQHGHHSLFKWLLPLRSGTSRTQPNPQCNRSIPPNTTFPTLHNTKLIVGTDGERVSFNDVLVVLPNLYFDGFCAVHGIARPLLPISPSSSIDDQTFAKPRMENKRSPMSKRRRARGIFKEYVRFIRRVNHPIPVDENKDSRNP